jgi:hypothetical protein
MIKLCMFVYIILNFKKLILKEDDNIVTKLFYRELADEGILNLNETEGLVFWVLKKNNFTSSKAEPLFLDDQEMDRYIKLEYL